jgi:site-specific recombinase XerD
VPTRADADTFAVLLGAFVEDLRVRRYSLASERCALSTLPRLFAFLLDRGIAHPRDVTEAHLVAFVRALEEATARHHDTPLSPMTRRSHIHTVRRFFSFLVRRGVLLHDPAAALPLPAPDYLPRTVLTVRQAAQLMTAPSPWTHLGQRERAILEVLYGSGIRRGECVRLDVSDVDLVQGTLLVKDSKGKRDRLVPLPGRAAAAIDAYLRDSRPVLLKDPCEKALFLSYTTGSRGRRLSVSALARVVEKHAKAVRLPHVHPHALRHTCATHVLQGGADLKHVQELLGHRSISSTVTYTRVGVRDLLAVFERAHPRERTRRRPRR